MKEITNLEFALFAVNGKKISSTFSEVNEIEAYVSAFVEKETDEPIHVNLPEKYHLFPVSVENDEDYYLVIYGAAEDISIIGRMAAYQIKNLILSKTEEFDRNNFV